MHKWIESVYLKTRPGQIGKRLWAQNRTHFELPLSMPQKLLITLYLVATDRVDGQFPRRFAHARNDAHQCERTYLDRLPGTSRTQMDVLGLTKPFWPVKTMRAFLDHFCRGVDCLYRHGITPSAKLIELGCGAGWMSELLARCGYQVLGTTLDPKTVRTATRRANAHAALDLPGSLEFREASMETLWDSVLDRTPFDAAVVYEALHHVHDWRLSLTQVAGVLRPGGVLLIMNEPNRLHTLKAYRVAHLTQTHEIGMSRRAIVRHLRSNGFGRIDIPKNRLGLGIRPIWIKAVRSA